jgi:hypothetical protein
MQHTCTRSRVTFEAVEHLGGGIGIYVLYIQTKIQNAGGDPDDVALWTRTQDVCRKNFFWLSLTPNVMQA